MLAFVDRWIADGGAGAMGIASPVPPHAVHRGGKGPARIELWPPLIVSGKEARDDATKVSKAIIAEQNRLVAIIEPEEQRLQALRDAWDTEQEKIKEAAAAAERYRVEQIIGRIEAIKGFVRMAMDCRTSAAVQRLQEGLAKVDLTGMDEFEAQA